MTATRGRLVDLTLCAVATAASALLYKGFFADAGYLPTLAGAAAGGTLLSGLPAIRSWSYARIVTLGAAATVLYVGLAAFTGTLRSGLPTLHTAREVGWGIVGGWARMLSVGTPAEDSGDLLTTPVVISWSAAAVAAVVVVRSRSAVAPLAAPLAAFVAALVLVGRSAADTLPATGVFLTAALLLVLRRTEGSSRRATLVRLPVGAVVAVAALGGGQAGLLASGEDRADPRTLYRPPLRVDTVLNPLSTLKSQLRQRPPRNLFTVHMDAGSPGVDRIRLTALDTFDGAQWTSSDRYLVAGQVLARAPGLSHAQRVSGRVVVEELADPFLPVVGWPRRFDPLGPLPGRVGFDDTSGVLATDAADLNGMTYRISGEIGRPDAALAFARPSTGSAYDPLRALPPDTPRAVEVMLHRVADRHERPFGKLKAIEEYLRVLPYDLDARPGHSYAVLNRFLGPRRDGDGTGYAEQHAAAFAVLARMLGYPARIAVGYRLPAKPQTTYQVTTMDAHAWAEVHFDGYGWVAFEPTDVSRTGAPRQPLPQTGPAPRHSAQPIPGAAASKPSQPPLTRPERPAGQDLLRLLLSVLGGLGVVTLALIPAVKLIRRRRRRRVGPAAARLAGAWAEAIDRLREHRMRVPAAMTPTEVAQQAARERFIGTGVTALGELARATTTAIFGAAQPDEQDVRAAWRLEAQLRRQLYPRRLSARRCVALMSPRPLVASWRDVRTRRRGKVAR